MKKILSLLLVATAAVFIDGCTKHDVFNGDDLSSHSKKDEAQVATDWYRLQLRILLERNAALNGIHFGYIGIGLYESTRFGTKNSVSLSKKLYQMPEMPAKENNNGYNWEVSANAAMASMVRSFYAGLTPANMASIDSLENAYNQRLKPGTPSANFERSQSFGRKIATAVYNWYLTDNVNGSNVGYILPVFAGAWIPTPPAFANPVNPYLGSARLFVAANQSTVAAAFPAPYSEITGSEFYKVVKSVYDVSQTLTTQQKDIAMFWIDQGNGIGYTPPGHDMFVITQALEQTGASLATAAEVYAKAGIAERDATIVCFKSKYVYNLIRPVSYIRKLIDPNWLPFIVTPPHPEYPAAHAYITGSVMQACSKVMGTSVKITDHSYDFRGWAPRSFHSLFQAAEEAGISRFYGGIHYLPSISIGLSMAKDLGNTVGAIKLTE